jgi:uncharacterized protein (TIGR04141 family)
MSIIKQNVKLYKIDTLFYELRDIKSVVDKIQYVVNDHRTRNDKIEELNQPLSNFQIEGFTYHLYVFSQNQSVSTWKDFLPQKLTKGEDFYLQETSFVLFIEAANDIYAMIGGTAIQVIKRYINTTFGLDTFAKIADIESNKVQSIKSRGVTGNVAGNATFYRKEHRLIDTISFGKIPSEINFEFTEESIVDIFDFIPNEERAAIFGRASSSFQIKTPLTFKQTHEFIKKITEIEKIESFTPLSSLIQITDPHIINELIRPRLFNILRDDMIKIAEPHNAASNKYDFDFCHPSKMAAFYECDEYRVYASKAQKPFLIVANKEDIYEGTMKHIYGNVEHTNLFSFMSFTAGIMVKGYSKGQRKTIATFIDHISCEIDLERGGVSYFCIDTKWYKVRGNFITDINDTSLKLLRGNKLDNQILINPWKNPKITDEGAYNLSYLGEKGFLVLDKMLGNNIEMCDLLYSVENKVYLIHVKKGFDAKIRDLSNQVIIAAQRLWDDTKSGKYSFVDSVFDSFQKSDNFKDSEIRDVKDFRDFFSKDKEIIFVLAFVSTLKNGKKIFDNFSEVQSNIAKYSVIDCIREMKDNNYPIQVVEIETQ